MVVAETVAAVLVARALAEEHVGTLAATHVAVRAEIHVGTLVAALVDIHVGARVMSNHPQVLCRYFYAPMEQSWRIL